MKGEGVDEDDSMVLNTMNQAELKKTLVDKKTKINVKKIVKKEGAKKLIKAKSPASSNNKGASKKKAVNVSDGNGSVSDRAVKLYFI